jgi:nucleoid DNA-binding protein
MRKWVAAPRKVFLYGGAMKRNDLARTLARETHQSKAQAQDEIDVLVNKILRALRQGKPVKLPGVGKLVNRAAGK